MKKTHLAAVAVALTASLPALANQDIVLDFEGVASFSSVGSFYPGISFSDAAVALKNDELGPYFSNSPTPGTVMFATDSSAVMNVAAGFVGEVSFWYSASTSALDVVTIYSGLDAGGAQLGSFSLSKNAQLGGCSDSPYCNWQRVSLSFSGTARSLTFGGNAGNVAFDNVAITAVPEPTTGLLMALGGSALLLGARRRQRG